jgi:hypothetical protein
MELLDVHAFGSKAFGTFHHDRGCPVVPTLACNTKDAMAFQIAASRVEKGPGICLLHDLMAYFKPAGGASHSANISVAQNISDVHDEILGQVPLGVQHRVQH